MTPAEREAKLHELTDTLSITHDKLIKARHLTGHDAPDLVAEMQRHRDDLAVLLREREAERSHLATRGQASQTRSR